MCTSHAAGGGPADCAPAQIVGGGGCQADFKPVARDVSEHTATAAKKLHISVNGHECHIIDRGRRGGAFYPGRHPSPSRCHSGCNPAGTPKGAVRTMADAERKKRKAAELAAKGAQQGRGPIPISAQWANCLRQTPYAPPPCRGVPACLPRTTPLLQSWFFIFYI